MMGYQDIFTHDITVNFMCHFCQESCNQYLVKNMCVVFIPILSMATIFILFSIRNP